MRRFRLSMATPFLFLVAAASGAAQPVAVPVIVNPSVHYQTIRGWGATANKLSLPPAVRDQLLDTAVNDLGLTRLRWEPPRREFEDALNDNGDPYHIEWSAFKSDAIEKRAREIILPFKQRVEANGDPFNLYISPSFFDGGSSGSAPLWMLNSPAEYTEWATAFLLILKQRYGIVPDYYCVCNEAGNNNAFTPERVGAIIKTLGPALRALGLPTRIQFPEGVNSGVSWRYIQALQNDAAVWPYIGLLSYHLYGDGSARPLIRDFAAARGIPTAQTEFMGTTVDHLYEDLTQGNVSYWEHYGLAGPWGGNGAYFTTALNGTSFRPYSQYWRFRQVMHYVRPGAVRVAAESGDPAVRTLAFTRRGKVTVVLLNTAPAAVERMVEVSGLPDGAYGVCSTRGNHPYQEMGVQRTAGGSLTLTLPAGAVLTVYPYSGANQPPVITEWRSEPGFLTAPAERITLFAAATDPENEPLTYSWAVTKQPEAAQVILAAPNAARTAVEGLLVPGDYVFTLTVRDTAHAVTRQVFLTRYAGNQPPQLIDLHNRLPVTVILPNSKTVLRGGALDLEGDPVTYRWSIVRQPEGAQAVLETPEKSGCTVTGLSVPGEYLFRLEASDREHTVEKTLPVTVYPINHAPVITSASATVGQAGEATLQAAATDPDGDAITFWWELLRAPEGAHPLIQRPGAARTRVSSLTVPGKYHFRVSGMDRSLSAAREVTLTTP